MFSSLMQANVISHTKRRQGGATDISYIDKLVVYANRLQNQHPLNWTVSALLPGGSRHNVITYAHLQRINHGCVCVITASSNNNVFLPHDAIHRKAAKRGICNCNFVRPSVRPSITLVNRVISKRRNVSSYFFHREEFATF